MAVLQVPVRASAISLVLSGVVLAVLLPFHPSIFDRPVSEVVRETAVWTPLHLAALAAFILDFLGAAGIVAVHGGRLGRLGQAGLVAILIGLVAGSAVMALEAIAFPILADTAPELLALGGPLLGSPLALLLGVLTLGWALGLVLIGAAAARARVFPRAAGVLLAVTAAAFILLAGPFVPVAGELSGVVFGAAHVWWGLLLWRAVSHPAAGSTVPEEASGRRG